MDILLKSWPEIGQQSMAHPEIQYYRDLKSIFTKCFYGCGNKRSYVKLKIKNNNSHIGIHSMRSTTQKKKKKKVIKEKTNREVPYRGYFRTMALWVSVSSSFDFSIFCDLSQ